MAFPPRDGRVPVAICAKDYCALQTAHAMLANGAQSMKLLEQSLSERLNWPIATSGSVEPMPTILPDIPQVEAAIVEITNTVRAEAGLSRVVVSPQLTAAARAYAALLARTGQFSHDADGTMQQRIERTGYQHCLIAENLALHQDSRGFQTRALAVAAMEGWLNSPGHRRNIMTGDVTEIGVAVAKGPDAAPKYIIVQVFGRPQALQVTFQVSNSSNETVSFAFGGKTQDVTPHLAITMHSCSAGPLTISAKQGVPFTARYDARDGTNYLITGGGGTPLKVEATKRHTVK